MSSDRWVAFATYSNHVDHLIPIAALVGAPLVVPDDASAAVVRQAYPPIEVVIAGDGGIARLGDARVILHSIRIPRQLVIRHDTAHKRFVCCPHGWSDKDWWLKWMALEDVFLSYGDATTQMLQGAGTWQLVHRHVLAGDYRFRYYQRNKAAFDAAAESELAPWSLRGRQTAIYAPTWQDLESASSLGTVLEPLIRVLPDDWNLIVKLHPFTTTAVATQVRETLRRIPGRGAVLADHPLVLPFLARADVYIGDRSSVGYDYLCFDRPIVLMRSASRAASRYDLLAACSTEIAEGAIAESAEQIFGGDVDDRLRSSRARIRNQVFSPAPPDDVLRAALIAACNGDLLRDGTRVPSEFLAERQRLMPLLPRRVEDERITLRDILVPAGPT
ncbi:MAG TPA: CDP-glycerol glycerophosphotransferase family protein [Kofleriaceae bacterium]